MNKADSAAAIRQELAQQLVQVLKLNRSELYADDPVHFDRLRLSSLGVDSLMALEIRSRVREWLGIDLPAQLLIGGTEIGEIMDVIRQKALLRCISQPALRPLAGASDAPALEVFVI
jgi:acyl carrier protein